MLGGIIHDFPPPPEDHSDDIKFPIDIDRNNNTIYDLYSVINHQGNLTSGHYFSYIKSFKNNKWYCFNDNMCSEIDMSNV